MPGKLGHEAAGFVEAIGQGVSNVKEGDRVVYVVASRAATARLELFLLMFYLRFHLNWILKLRQNAIERYDRQLFI